MFSIPPPIFTFDYGDVDSAQIVTPQLVYYPIATGTTTPGLLYPSGTESSPAIVEVYSVQPAESGWPQTFSIWYAGLFGVSGSQSRSTVYRRVTRERCNCWRVAATTRSGHSGSDWSIRISVGGYDALMQAFRYLETWAASGEGDGFTDIIAVDEKRGGMPQDPSDFGYHGENEAE